MTDEKYFQPTCCATDPINVDVYVTINTSDGLSLHWVFEDEHDAAIHITRIFRAHCGNVLKGGARVQGDVTVRMMPLSWR